MNYDVIIVGAGAAGSTCVERLNAAGLNVALIERDALGGTCLNYGCDPTKTMLHTARVLHEARQRHGDGLTIPEAAPHWWNMQQRVTAVQNEMRGGTRQAARAQMRERGIDLITGEASFVSAHEVTVNGRIFSADHFLIATGTEPAIPDVTGLLESDFVTNKTILGLPSLPARLAIVGGGPIGVEFAQLFARLGCSVRLIQSGPHILPKDDPELADELATILRAEGVHILTATRLTAVSSTAEGSQKLTLFHTSGDEREIETQTLLVAAGRRPAIDSLNLDAAGVATAGGQVQVDDSLRTNVPHIWAAGDVSSQYPFTHAASREGLHVANCILSGFATPYSPGPIPWVTYTDPELAHVGQTEAELTEAGIPYRVVSQPMRDVARAIATGQQAGRVKLLVNDEDQIVGGHILAANGGELLAPVLLAMRTGIPASALAQTVWPYPTMSAVFGRLAVAESA